MIKMELQDVTVSYQEKKQTITAVRNISFQVATGDFIVLLGPSGCGKTTLLKTIGGLIPYDEGTISFNGIDADLLTIKERNLAYMPQNYSLYPHLTIYDNIAMPLKAARLPINEIIRRVETVAKEMEIDFLLTRKPRHLSGGQQQRVALARCFVKRPDIYLLDEPFSNLDPARHRRLRHELIKMHRRWRATIIMATHDLEDAFSLATKVVVMNKDGMIAQIGAPIDVYNKPSTADVANFITGKENNHEPNI
ncbi:MAG: ABC transporter ATP-binding protein [Bacilli bacterium]|nr:ABC transporter ATP-binding protein [Bacilli bacterium]